MYKYIEAAHIALTSILSHKLRSFLTLLGVIIGVAVVTAVATVIEGANVYIKEKIATLGSGVFSVQKASITSFGDFQKFIDAWKRNPDLTLDDLAALREQVNLADQIGATDGTAPRPHCSAASTTMRRQRSRRLPAPVLTTARAARTGVKSVTEL